jgi:hypothetical protein
VHDIANVLKKTSAKQYPFASIKRYRFALARFVRSVDLLAGSKLLLQPGRGDRERRFSLSLRFRKQQHEFYVLRSCLRRRTEKEYEAKSHRSDCPVAEGGFVSARNGIDKFPERSHR